MAAILHKVRKDETVLSLCFLYCMSHERFIELNPQFGVLGCRSEQLYTGERIVVGESTNPVELLKVMEARRRL